MAQVPEHWLRGEVPGVPALLQPVAHALLQARDELRVLVNEFNDAGIWDTPAGVASVGFHLKHMRGVIDRLFTYARGEALTAEQLAYLRKEQVVDDSSTTELLGLLEAQVDDALMQLRATDEQLLRDVRNVGRAKLPSTVQGLLFHAAEHTMRHTGQLLVTARVVAAADARSEHVDT